jgi:hypothetical protein
LDGDTATAQQVIAQLDTSPVATLLTLVVQEEKKQSDDKKTDSAPVVTNQCTK